MFFSKHIKTVKNQRQLKSGPESTAAKRTQSASRGDDDTAVGAAPPPTRARGVRAGKGRWVYSHIVNHRGGDPNMEYQVEWMGGHRTWEKKRALIADLGDQLVTWPIIREYEQAMREGQDVSRRSDMDRESVQLRGDGPADGRRRAAWRIPDSDWRLYDRRMVASSAAASLVSASMRSPLQLASSVGMHDRVFFFESGLAPWNFRGAWAEENEAAFGLMVGVVRSQMARVIDTKSIAVLRANAATAMKAWELVAPKTDLSILCHMFFCHGADERADTGPAHGNTVNVFESMIGHCSRNVRSRRDPEHNLISVVPPSLTSSCVMLFYCHIVMRSMQET